MYYEKVYSCFFMGNRGDVHSFLSGVTKNEAVAMRDKTAKPRTALVEADENLKNAIQEENNPLIAKYLLEYVHYQLLISQDSFPSLIRLPSI